MPRQPDSYDEFIRRAEEIERRHETAEEREVRHFYARPQICGCQHILGMHDFPMGECMEHGCTCASFRMPPAAAHTTKVEEAA